MEGWTERLRAAARTIAALSPLATDRAATDGALRRLVASIPFEQIDDPKLVDYLLNTVVSKIPFPEMRMELYQRAGMKVDPTTTIMMHCFVLSARNITIGPQCVIGPFTTLDGRGGEILGEPEDSLRIGRNVRLAGHVLTVEGMHKVDSPTAEGVGGKIMIGDDACVGERATILPGVTVGEGAAVAAAALVNRDVAPHVLVAGIPARKIGDWSRDLPDSVPQRLRWI